MKAITNKEKINSLDDFKNQNNIWVCYRCNLTFREAETVFLHNKITRHSARKIGIAEGRNAIA